MTRPRRQRHHQGVPGSPAPARRWSPWTASTCTSSRASWCASSAPRAAASRPCLNIVGGLETATAGEVRLGGDLVVGPGPTEGWCSRATRSSPGDPSRENIAFGLECAGWTKAAARRAGGRDARDRRPRRVGRPPARPAVGRHATAGGHRPSARPRTRRAAARRALRRPRRPDQAVLQDFLLQVRHRTGATVLMVTHDVTEAVYLSQRIYVLATRPGRVAEEVDVPFGRRPRPADPARPSVPRRSATRSRTSSTPSDRLRPGLRARTRSPGGVRWLSRPGRRPCSAWAPGSGSSPRP